MEEQKNKLVICRPLTNMMEFSSNNKRLSCDDESSESEDASVSAMSYTTEDSDFCFHSSDTDAESEEDDYDPDFDLAHSLQEASLLKKRKSSNSSFTTDSSRSSSFERIDLTSFLQNNENVNATQAAAPNNYYAITSEVKRIKVNQAIFAFFQEHNVPMEAVEDPVFLKLVEAIQLVKYRRTPLE